MNNLNIKNLRNFLIGMLSITLLCGMICTSAFAAYNYEGFPLETIENGTVQGDVYVSYGDNAGLNDSYPWNYTRNTLITTFENVPTSGIKWAELKAGVWGGSTSRVGWAEIRLDETLLTTETLNVSDLSENVSCCGSGVYLIHCNCTELVKEKNSDGTIVANITAWPDTSQGDSKRLDSRIYGAALIIVYENGDYYTQYWINQGPVDLHKSYTGHPYNNANITWFNGTPLYTGGASLTVGYLAGDYGQRDYLYFNVPSADDSPYNFSNAMWDLTNATYARYKVDGNDVANENFNTTKYFDLHKFYSVRCMDLCNSSNNYAIFWRGHNDTYTSYDIYDPPYPQVNPETESYYVPFLAVLKLHNVYLYDFSSDTEGVAGVVHKAYRFQNDSRAPTTNDVPDIEFTDAEYENIMYDDQVFQSDVTNADGNFAAHRFAFNVSNCHCGCLNISDIDAINVTWNGKGWHDAGDDANGTFLYIWNYTSQSYEELDDCAGDGSENYLTGERCVFSGYDLSNYIDENCKIIVLAEQKTEQYEDEEFITKYSHIESDYVKLILKS